MLAIVSGQGPKKTDPEKQELFGGMMSGTSPIRERGRHNWTEEEVKYVVATEAHGEGLLVLRWPLRWS